MINDANTKKVDSYQKLNVIWGVLTSSFVLIVLFFIWQSESKTIDREIEIATHQLSSKFDSFIDDLTDKLYSSGMLELNYSKCQNQSQSVLHHLVVNISQISALTILNQKRKAVCSTLPAIDANAPLPIDFSPRSLQGPFKMNGIEKPIYLLTHQIGKNFIEIYLLQGELEKLLKTKLTMIKSVYLYDTKSQKILLKITRSSSNINNWNNKSNTPAPLATFNNDFSNNRNFTLENLDHLNDIAIITEKDEVQLFQLTIRYMVMAGMVLLIMSFGTYFYLRRVIHQHFSLHRAIVSAIRNDEFYPVYQPIMDRQLNQCCGAEVLLRWRVNAQETIMPDLFIDYAEQSGLIVPITLQLADKVFLECEKLLQQNPHFHMAINLSSAHFSDPHFFEKLIELCKIRNIGVNQIMLEVTERDLLQNDLNLVTKMHDLREAGFSIAVDDFGTGHASISYLQHFPFNYLKIDRLFVNAIGTGAVTESLNQSIIEMAKRLGLKVIAEGVETYQQLETLEANGANLIQGWYFSKAIPFEKFILFLNRNS